ncbi:MAG: DUF4469 domain-containing protein [Tannerella sp.]|nr:DUF4469 domain-containing protein [Tannerella sp.]
MTILKTIAHLNELTEETTDDYYLLPDIKGTLHEEDIIRRLEAKEIATKNVNGPAFVQLFHRECALAVSEGYNVVTGMFHATIGLKGVVYAKDLGHHLPAGQVSVHTGLIQGEYAREAVKDLTISVAEQPAPTGPVIQSVTNPVANVPDTINTGEMVLLQGMRLAVRGDKPDEIGVFFTYEDEVTVVRIPATHLSPNTPKKLQFVLPAEVSAGNWKVKVATQATSNSKMFTENVRTYEYPNTITVV